MPDFTSTTEAKAATSDLVITGDPDAWELVCKVSSKSGRFAKSTKRMAVYEAGLKGYLYQVTTEHRDLEGVVSACSDALTFVSL